MKTGGDEVKSFRIRRDPLVRPLFAVFGATQAKSYVEIDDGELRIRLGGLFDQSVPLANVVGVERATWSLWRGLGIRMGPRATIAVVGSTEGIVQLALSPKVPIKVLFNIKSNCEKLLLSLDNPDDFVREMSALIETARAPSPAGR